MQHGENSKSSWRQRDISCDAAGDQPAKDERFLEIVKKSKEKDGFELIAWCLMLNHVHLLIHENKVKNCSSTFFESPGSV